MTSSISRYIWPGCYDLIPEKPVQKSAIAKVTGINQQQLNRYAKGYRKSHPAVRKKIVDGIHSIAKEMSAIS